MGIRKPSVKTERPWCRGMGVAVRLPNNTTVRCDHRHIQLYVGIMCAALLRPTLLSARCQTALGRENKSPARARL